MNHIFYSQAIDIFNRFINCGKVVLVAMLGCAICFLVSTAGSSLLTAFFVGVFLAGWGLPILINATLYNEENPHFARSGTLMWASNPIGASFINFSSSTSGILWSMASARVKPRSEKELQATSIHGPKFKAMLEEIRINYIERYGARATYMLAVVQVVHASVFFVQLRLFDALARLIMRIL